MTSASNRNNFLKKLCLVAFPFKRCRLSSIFHFYSHFFSSLCSQPFFFPEWALSESLTRNKKPQFPMCCFNCGPKMSSKQLVCIKKSISVTEVTLSLLNLMYDWVNTRWYSHLPAKCICSNSLMCAAAVWAPLWSLLWKKRGSLRANLLKGSHEFFPQP